MAISVGLTSAGSKKRDYIGDYQERFPKTKFGHVGLGTCRWKQCWPKYFCFFSYLKMKTVNREFNWNNCIDQADNFGGKKARKNIENKWKNINHVRQKNDLFNNSGYNWPTNQSVIMDRRYFDIFLARNKQTKLSKLKLEKNPSFIHAHAIRLNIFENNDLQS